jgi:hypothetical protein
LFFGKKKVFRKQKKIGDREGAGPLILLPITLNQLLALLRTLLLFNLRSIKKEKKRKKKSVFGTPKSIQYCRLGEWKERRNKFSWKKIMFAYLIHFAFKATAAYIISYTLGQLKVEKKNALAS